MLMMFIYNSTVEFTGLIGQKVFPITATLRTACSNLRFIFTGSLMHYRFCPVSEEKQSECGTLRIIKLIINRCLL